MPRTNQQSSIHLTWNPKADYWNAGTMLALCSGPISTVNPSMICPFANESSRLFLFFVSHFSTLSFSLLLKNDCFDSLPCCVPSGRRNIIFASSVHWSLNFTQLKSSDNFRNSASERPACRHKQSQQFQIYRNLQESTSFYIVFILQFSFQAGSVLMYGCGQFDKTWTPKHVPCLPASATVGTTCPGTAKGQKKALHVSIAL